MERSELINLLDEETLSWLASELYRVLPNRIIENLARQVVMQSHIIKGKDIMRLLTQLGITVNIKDGQPMAGPARLITPEVATLIRLYRPQILNELMPPKG